ncbi:MAG: hypothetical protein OHK0013_15890 [Sandaracinaceae bacterium]
MRPSERHVLSAIALAAAPLSLGGCPPAPAPADAGRDAPAIDAWARTRLHDPLSMPAEPTLSPNDFESADTCEGCHAEHAAEWRTSMHAYAMVDPVFRALVRVRQTDFDGMQDAFCVQCHSAIGTRGGEITPGFSFEGLSPIVQEGVTCQACHQVTELARDHNSGHVIDPRSPMRATIADPVMSSRHGSAYSALHGTSEFCAGCHDVVEVSGLSLERPYEEWLSSPAAAEGRHCQSCHMPTTTRRAARTGPERTVHSHRFVGVDLPLAEGFATPEETEALRADVRALLASAADLRLRVAPSVRAGAQLDVVVDVENRIDAHALPTGSTFIRQLWVELVVRDADGAVVYETGTLDANGDLRDHWSALAPYGDPDLLSFASSLTNARGAPELFPWRATEHFRRTIQPGHTRTATLFVPTTAATPGPLTVEARLRFRSHPPYLLRALGLEALIPRVEIHDVDTASVTVEVVP